jgi:hypothetical protein
MIKPLLNCLYGVVLLVLLFLIGCGPHIYKHTIKVDKIDTYRGDISTFSK